MQNVNKKLKDYIEKNIFPLYDDNIGGHGLEHIKYVIDRSFELIEAFSLDVNPDIVYTTAAFHDLGYKINKDEHERVSSEMFLENKEIKNFFTTAEVNIIAEAIVDHRASLEYEPRSLYGKIVSSADRETSVTNMLTRSILFQYDKHKKENPTMKEVIDYSYQKLSSKYGKGGYAKMYFPDSKYLSYLENMQEVLNDKNSFANEETKIIERLNQNEDTHLAF